jgi:hypothetical protein
VNTACLRDWSIQATRRICIGLCFVALSVLAVACASSDRSDTRNRLPATISGVVITATGPAANAIVQIQGTPNQVRTDSVGRFTLHGQGLGGSRPVTITAWADEHFINWVKLDPASGPPPTELSLLLKPLFNNDNHQYNWFSFEGATGSASCGVCHREYPEWQSDMHSQAAVNPRFTSMFRGTDIQGRRSPPTEYITLDSAKLPDPSLPYYGPGFRLDFPQHAGTCATCHTPAAAKIEATNSCAWSGCHTELTADKAETQGYHIRGVLPVGIVGIGEEGVTCEFCHVISGSTLNPATGLPPPDQPGILSLHMRRPPDGEKQFFGTLTDVSRDVTYTPFLKSSQFCASCHFGVFGGVVSNMKMTGGTVIYNSYGEWLNSPYSDPKTGKSCQECHMARKDTQFSVPPERGGVARDYVAYHDHTMLGPSTSQTFMWQAATVKPELRRNGDELVLDVSVTNTGAGHAIPTDAPMRSVMLIIEARDSGGAPLTLREGPVLPDWAGGFAGQPGRGYARILKDNWTGQTPATAFWRATTEVLDTRLKPLSADVSRYTFANPAGQPARITIKLVWRRAFESLARQKGWTDPDIIMFEETINP